MPQCNHLPNDSKLPEDQTDITKTKLSPFDIEDEGLYTIIEKIGVNKAHGHDEVSRRMLILRDKSRASTFPNLWKKANVVATHQKGEKDLIKSYRPVSLSPIFEKVFERLIFNSLFKYIGENELLNPY